MGIFQMTISVLHDLIGRDRKNARHKDLLDQLHQRMSINMTRVTGLERKANLFVFLFLLHTNQGKGIMEPFLVRCWGPPECNDIHNIALDVVR